MNMTVWTGYLYWIYKYNIDYNLKFNKFVIYQIFGELFFIVLQ